MESVDPGRFISPSSFLHKVNSRSHLDDAGDVLETVDFLPPVCTSLRRISALSSSVGPQSPPKEFSGLIIRANTWLCDHPQARVRNAETVDFNIQLKDGCPNVYKSHYRTRGDQPNKFIRGLRLWVILHPEHSSGVVESPAPEQIGFMDLAPAVPKKTKGCAYNIEGETDSLGQLIDKGNAILRHFPWRHRLLTVETVNVVLIGGTFDTESCTWIDRDYATQNFVTALRIFYTQEKEIHTIETIKIADFIPSVVITAGKETNIQRPRLETFSTVFAKCAAYVAKLSHSHRILNIQTLTFRQQGMSYIDTSQTAFCEDNMHTYQVKFLRLALAITREDVDTGFPRPLSVTRSLLCQLFVPELISLPKCTGKLQFEDQLATKQKLQRWVARCHIAVVSVETHHIRIFCGAENFEGFETMHTWNRVIHHTNAAHNHIHNFLHGRTHHRHGVRLRESTAASERFLTVYRIYYNACRSGQSDICSTQTLVEHVMLSKSNSLCRIL